MVAAQGGLCAICRRPQTGRWKSRLKQLGVDHDHVTGEIRGLLCDGCNHGLGSFRNDPALLAAGIDYLKANASRAAPAEAVRPRRRNPDHWAKTLKPCLVCGREVALASWGKYCSSACSSKAAYARRKKIAILTLGEGRAQYMLAPNAPSPPYHRSAA